MGSFEVNGVMVSFDDDGSGWHWWRTYSESSDAHGPFDSYDEAYADAKTNV